MNVEKNEFGKLDIERTTPLFLSEAYHVLEKCRQRDAASGVPFIEMQAVRSMYRHVRAFDTIVRAESSRSVRQLLENSANNVRLTPFEVAQLATLTPRDVFEAKAVIPSLHDRDDAHLASLLGALEQWLNDAHA